MTKDQVLHHLDTMISLIKRGWTQGAFARDDAGNSVHVSAPFACEWCLMGAAMNACNGLSPFKVGGFYGFIEDALPGIGIVTFNDTTGRTQQEVLTFLEDFKKQVEGLPESEVSYATGDAVELF